ncbi:MAG TPA: hypothetical protein VES38_10690 [Methylotenera sp.]|nr:hypothetical protein [Methylotenera sp.]
MPTKRHVLPTGPSKDVIIPAPVTMDECLTATESKEYQVAG